MATTAPEHTKPEAARAGSTRSSPTGSPGTGAPHEVREPATGRPLLTLAAVDARRRRPGRRRGRGRPARLGRDELRRSAPRSSAARPTSTRPTAPSSGRGPSARPARVHSKMHHEQNFAAGELHAAATMPFQPYGQLVPERRARAPVDAPARPGRRHRRDHAVELAVACWACGSSRPALAARQRRRPQARSADAGVRRRDVRGGVPRGRPARGPAPDRHRRRRVGEAIVTDPNVDRVSFTGSTAAGRPRRRAGRRPAQAGQPRARRQQRVRRARRRRPRGRRLGRRVRLVPVPGPGLLRDRAPHRPPQRRRRRTSTCWPRRPRRLRLGDPYREDVDLGPIVNEKQLERVDGIVRRSVDGGRPRRRRRHARGPVLPPDRAHRRHDRPGRRGARRSSARSRRSSCSTPTRRRSRSPTTASTG